MPYQRSRPVTDGDYRRLLAFRTELRRFTRWSEQAARDEGLTPALHQLLLAVRGLSGDRPPTIGDVAEMLLVQHHSAVELVTRAEALELLARERDTTNHREVRLRLTPSGTARLADLSHRHLTEIKRLSDALRDTVTPRPGLSRPEDPSDPNAQDRPTKDP